MRAILTFARSWSALAAARSLGRKGIEVVTGDEYGCSAASFSRYSVAHFPYPNPDREPEAFLDALEEAIRAHRPADGQPYVLMPVHKETYLISRHRERFEPLIRMALPSYGQIRQVHDKGSLALYCAGRGLPTPRTVVPATRVEFLAAAETFAYPAFVKVRESAGAVGVRKVADAVAAIAAFEEFAGSLGLGDGSWPILQHAVPGDDYCATFLFERGEPRATMTYHNLRSYPAGSGTGVLRETVKAPEIERIGEGLLAGLGWHGVAEIDFRWTGGDAVPSLIEVNPRFWGGLPQAVEAGWDYPYLLYRLAVDGTVARVDPPASDVRTETPVMGLLATLQEAVNDDARMEAMRRSFEGLKGSYVRGNRGRALRRFMREFPGTADVPGRWERAKALFRDHRRSVSDLFRWEDPLPALGVFYPLAVFLQSGRCSLEYLVGEGRAAVKSPR